MSYVVRGTLRCDAGVCALREVAPRVPVRPGLDRVGAGVREPAGVQVNPVTLYTRARTIFGADAQVDMAIEEAGEFIVSAQHMKRGRSDLECVEETADMIIMGEQMRLILGADRVDEMVARKLERLAVRVDEAEMRARESERPVFDDVPTVTHRAVATVEKTGVSTVPGPMEGK
jgi:hypothetical protein